MSSLSQSVPGTSPFYGRASEAAETILAAFKDGRIPAALAQTFIHRKDNVPCRSWSWSNQLLAALHGTSDARGYRQWQEVGRHVKAGEHGFPILVPLCRKVTQTDAETGQEVERTRVYGFKSAIVFGLEQTEGADVPSGDPDTDRWFAELPLRAVAESWGLSVATYNGADGRALGRYTHGAAIAVGVKNLSTWAHELTHAADDRLGHLTERGQHWRSEIVAELGGATLLTAQGMAHEADWGGCWQYLAAYAKDAGLVPLVAVQRVVKRTCEAVALILEEAARLSAAETAAA